MDRHHLDLSTKFKICSPILCPFHCFVQPIVNYTLFSVYTDSIALLSMISMHYLVLLVQLITPFIVLIVLTMQTSTFYLSTGLSEPELITVRTKDGFVLCCLMTPGPSKDIWCHV